MKFELGIADGSQCHPAFQDAIALWKNGDSAGAYQSARKVVKDGEGVKAEDFSVDDWLLLTDLASSCGFFDISYVFSRAGYRHHPDNSFLGALVAWDLSARRKFFECQEALEKIELLDPDQAWTGAIRTYNFSIVGWRKSADEAHDKAVNHAGDDPLAWYILSRAAAHRALWQLAVEEGKRALSLAPKWSRARCALHDSLISTGQLEEARQLLDEADTSRAYCTMDLCRAIEAEASGDIDQTIARLQESLKKWPLKNKMTRWSARHLAMHLLKKNEIEEANRVIERYKIRRFDSLEKNKGNNRYIPQPLVAQAYNHCVPTVAAMVAGSQSVRLKPQELAEQMKTRNGTPIFRMIDHMVSLGFRAECIKIEAEIVEKVLDQGVALIGTLNGLFSSHVDVLCGFHSGLKLFHLRDPMHWFGGSIEYKHLQKHYQESEGLWALISPQLNSQVVIEDNWRDPIGKAFVDLTRACARGQRETAEKNFESIPDGHDLANLRDRRGRAIVITPAEYERRLAQQAMPTGDKDQLVKQFRAMMMRIDDQSADEIEKLSASKDLDLPDNFQCYIRAQCAMAKHQWRRAEKELDELARQWPSLNDAWSRLSIVQTQLGNREAARASLERALDIEPENEGYEHRLLEMDGTSLTFDERRKRIQKIVAESKDIPESLYDLIETLADGPNGKHYEEVLQKCMSFFPRDPYVYSRLAAWYMVQERRDLAGETLKNGRELIGEEELPKWEFEQENDESGSETIQNNEDASQDQVTPAADSESSTKHAGNESNNSSEGQNASNEGLYKRLMDSVSKQVDQINEASKNGNRLDAILKIPELVQLRKLQKNGEIPWWESVELTGGLVNQLSAEIDRQPDEIDTLTRRLGDFLPAKVNSGVPEIYATRLMEQLTDPIPRPIIEGLIRWMDDVCTHKSRFPALQFERAFLLEKLKRFNDSQLQLEDIIERHPAYAPAFYRLGQISSSRHDYRQATEYYEQCLSITPGNAGAIDELVAISGHLRSDDYIDQLERRVELFPYCGRHLYDTAFAIGHRNGHQEAIQRIDSAKREYPEARIQLYKARYWCDVQEFEQAEKIVLTTEFSEEDQYIASWIKVDCCVARQDYQQIEQTLRDMESRWPKDRDVIDQLARVLRELNVDEAEKFAKQKINDGYALPVLAYICLQNSKRPDQRAKNIIESIPLEYQDYTVDVFAEALNRPETYDHYMNFLRWCGKNYPHLTGLQSTLAVRLNLQGMDDDAIKIAERLYNSEPHNPDFLRLIGICIQDKDPKKSIEYLEREYEVTGSADTLCRIARGYQVDQQHDKAKEFYRKALELNPSDTLAMTNLAFKYKQFDHELFDLMCGAIKIGEGIEDQYFHVIVVKSAIKLDRVIPEEWFSTAWERFRLVQTEGGFYDEEEKLRSALLAWTVKNKHAELPVQLGGFFAKLKVRWGWPGLRWIPATNPGS